MIFSQREKERKSARSQLHPINFCQPECIVRTGCTQKTDPRLCQCSGLRPRSEPVRQLSQYLSGPNAVHTSPVSCGDFNGSFALILLRLTVIAVSNVAPCCGQLGLPSRRGELLDSGLPSVVCYIFCALSAVQQKYSSCRL